MSTSGSDVSPVTAVVIGAGNRGTGYAEYAHVYPETFKIVGVADPRKFYRNRLQKRFNIPHSNVFTDWKDAAEREKFADCVIITTPDRLHKDPAVAFAKKGYHLLLEKPMAVFESDCREIVKTCQENSIILMVCHVLRYTPWAQKLKELIDSGIIGDVVNIQHLEPVGFWHFAHSFVRGNWHREETSTCSLLAKCCHDLDLINYWMSGRHCCHVSSFGSLSHFNKNSKVGFWHFAHSYVRGNWHREDKSSFSLLAKCCHDIDLINYWMGKKKFTSVSSFGSLMHFNKESKPKGAAKRCLDCPQDVESNCPYSAKKIYLEHVERGYTHWPISVITEEPTVKSVTEALRTGPYGICVYDNDNDVMSNQIVNMQFTGGSTASLTMMAFTESICQREVNIFGTRGELRYNEGSGPEVLHYDFVTRKRIFHPTSSSSESREFGGHGGADFHCISTFVEAVVKGDSSCVVTGPEETLASHLLTFAAEKARKENIVVSIKEDGTF